MINNQIYATKLSKEIAVILKHIQISRDDSGGYTLTNTLLIPAGDTTSALSKSELVNVLQETIYRQFYKRLDLPKANTLSDKNKEFKENIENAFAAISVECNREFEEEWLAESLSLETGMPVVKKRDYEKKLIYPGHYLHKSLDFPFINDERLKVSWFKAKRFGKDAYLYLHGHHIPDDYSGKVNQVRFYLNFIANEEFKKNIDIFKDNSDANIDKEKLKNSLFSKLLNAFNERKIPFQIKLLTVLHPVDVKNREDLKKYEYVISDTAVIYLENKYFFPSFEIIRHTVTNFKNILAEHVPMFVYPLAHGVGFAESPTDSLNSFGQERSFYIAEKIIKFFIKKATLPTEADLLNTIEKDVQNKNTRKKEEPKPFYLNPKSYYPYDLTYPFVSEAELDNFSRGDIIQTARRIGYIICKEAVFDQKKRCNWIGSNNRKTAYKTLNSEVLEGVSGVALFLSELYAQEPDPVYLPILMGTLNTLRDDIINNDEAEIKKNPLGFYRGLLGSVYTLLRASKKIVDKIPTWKRPHEFDEAINKGLSVYSNCDTTAKKDILEGLAGEIMALLKINDLLPEQHDFIANLIRKKAEDLQGIDTGSFISGNHLIYSGYARGLSGIGLTLIEVGIFLKDGSLQTKGMELIILELEKLTNDRSHPSWSRSKQAKSTIGLCLVLNRLIALKMSNDKIIARLFRFVNNLEFNKVLVNEEPDLQTSKVDFEFLRLLTVEEGLGTLELILEMKDNFSEGLLHIYNRLYQQIIVQYISQGIANDTYSLENSDKNVGFQVNLFQGLAGIGYGLLRMYKPKDIEPILLLKP